MGKEKGKGMTEPPLPHPRALALRRGPLVPRNMVAVVDENNM